MPATRTRAIAFIALVALVALAALACDGGGGTPTATRSVTPAATDTSPAATATADQETPAADETVTGPIVYVAFMRLGVVHTEPGVRSDVLALICVVFGEEQPVEGARVAATLTGPGVLQSEATGVTTTDRGCAEMSWPINAQGRYTAKVSDVTFSGARYRPSENVVDEASIDVTDQEQPLPE